MTWAGIGFLLALGVFSVAMPTTVWDAQTFHLPRVMHWLQARDVEAYATNIPRQIEYPPGVEMMIAQGMLLAGNDRAANLPQWFGLLTCAILAGFLARKLYVEGAGRSGTREAAAGDVVATMPGAAAQSMSSLCDLVATMWTMAAVALGWLWFADTRNRFYGAGCAAAVALAIGAKVTTALYAAPCFCCWGRPCCGGGRFARFLKWRRWVGI